jgi:hypothetical protein
MNSFLLRSLSEPERDSGSTIEEEGSSILSSSESREDQEKMRARYVREKKISERADQPSVPYDSKNISYLDFECCAFKLEHF